MKFNLGDLVTGKKASILVKRGRIISIDANGRRSKNRVVWEDNTEGEYFSKALEARRAEATIQPANSTPNNVNNLTNTPSQPSRDDEDEDTRENSDSESSRVDSEEDEEFGDREGTNELHPEDGLPPHVPTPNGTAQDM
jgi:hypothetical protein